MYQWLLNKNLFCFWSCSINYILILVVFSDHLLFTSISQRNVTEFFSSRVCIVETCSKPGSVYEVSTLYSVRRNWPHAVGGDTDSSCRRRGRYATFMEHLLGARYQAKHFTILPYSVFSTTLSRWIFFVPPPFFF